MKDINFEAFREYLLDNPDYTTEDMELICQACSDWDNNRDEFYKERPGLKKPKDVTAELLEALKEMCQIEREQDPESRNVHDSQRKQYEKLIKKAEGGQ